VLTRDSGTAVCVLSFYSYVGYYFLVSAVFSEYHALVCKWFVFIPL